MTSSQITITQRLNAPLQNTVATLTETTVSSVSDTNSTNLLTGVENIRFDDGGGGGCKNWTTKERIFLVSCVLIYGDSNWSFVSEQLRRFMQLTSTADDILTLNDNKLSKTVPVNQFKRSVYVSTINGSDKASKAFP